MALFVVRVLSGSGLKDFQSFFSLILRQQDPGYPVLIAHLVLWVGCHSRVKLLDCFCPVANRRIKIPYFAMNVWSGMRIRQEHLQSRSHFGFLSGARIMTGKL